MALVSLGDLAQSYLLRRQTTAVKADIQRLSTELTTGRVTDAAARLAGDLVPLSGIDASLARLTGYETATTTAAMVTNAMQEVLGSVDAMASDLAATLIAASGSAEQTRLNAVGSDARQQLETAISLLNARFGDRSLFAGVATEGPALTDAGNLLDVLETVTAGANSAADVEAAVSAWFVAPTGYATTAYTGGPSLAPMPIAPGETAHIPISARDPTIAATLKGLAMAALLDRGALAGQPQARQDLARRAGLSLTESQTSRAHQMAHLGTVQAQVDAAAVRNGAEATSLKLVRTGLVESDPYETALRLQEAESQLEKIFTITARMSRLSLVDFLR